MSHINPRKQLLLLTKPKLIRLCKSKKLSTNGTKADMVQRLLNSKQIRKSNTVKKKEQKHVQTEKKRHKKLKIYRVTEAKKERIRRFFDKNKTIASDNLLAKSNPVHMHPVEPLFAKSIPQTMTLIKRHAQTEKSKVYGYIRQQCQPLLPVYISMDITHIVLYYYCFSEEQYDGSIDEWTKDELCGRYIPLQPLHISQKPKRMFFEGKSTWFSPSKQLEFGAPIVIKKITDFEESSEVGSMQRILLLLRELVTLRTVSDHPSIVDLYDVLPDPNDVDALTLIYEHAETDLRHITTTNQYFSSSRVQLILYQILCGVQYIHDAEIIHHDLHPSSILINAHGRVKITSFNKACGIHERQFFQISCPQYTAPEMLLLQQPYAKDLCLSDMWAVGCIFAELLQMEKVNCRNPQHRRPLFEVIWIDQLRGIFEVIGYQRDCDVDWITDQDTRKRVDRIRASFFYSHHSICDAHFDYDKSREAEASRLATRFSGTTKDGVALLNNMLKFNIRRRLRAKHAIKSTYFDKVRDSNLENMMPSRTYKYPQIKQYGREQLPKNEFNRLLSEEISNYA
eukprot:755818_1